jgi:hypothetical protein
MVSRQTGQVRPSTYMDGNRVNQDLRHSVVVAVCKVRLLRGRTTFSPMIRDCGLRMACFGATTDAPPSTWELM